MNDKDAQRRHAREAKINALLDGELDSADAEALKAEAADDRQLARDIVEAYELQRAMDRLRPEPAPSRLRRRLRRIPREYGAHPRLLQPRWVAALATVPLLAVVLLLARPQEPSRAEVETAAAELAIALAYIEKVSDRATRRIEREVGGELQEAVGAGVIRSIPYLQTDSKETHA